MSSNSPGNIKQSSSTKDKNAEKIFPKPIAEALVQGATPASSIPPGSRVLTLCHRGDWGALEQVLRGLEKGSTDVSAVDEETGMTPLMYIVKENKLVLAERVLDLGANLTDKTLDGRTVMHFAAAHAKDDVMKLLITKKADGTVVGGPKDQLPLHYVCTRAVGGSLIVQLLVKISGKEARLQPDKDGLIPIALATEVGNLAVCKELLAHYTEQQITFIKKDTGDSLLHIASKRRDSDLVRLFLEAGANADVQDEEGLTPLHIAASEGDESLIKLFYLGKANPNICDKLDRTPLHIAAEKGLTNVVEILTEKFKSLVHSRTKDGSTLMHIAAQCGHPETALAFLKKGVPLHMPNKSGAVCLHAAAKRGHTAVVKSLLQKGSLVDARTKDNYTALHIAVQYGKPMVVETLLGYGALVNLQGGKAQETALHIAARTDDGEKCAEMLIKSGADVNAPQENGETALHIAARNGFIKMISMLLEEGADPACQSKAGETPLHVAIRYCHFEVAQELLRFLSLERSRVDAVMLVNQQAVEGETSVHYAAEITKKMVHYENEDTDIMKLLLEFEGDTNIQTKLTQETPVHYCARAGNQSILLEIVRHLDPNLIQTAINRQAKNGWSALLGACEQGHLEVVKILLQNHARVDVFDEHGKAALHLTAENGHEEVADTLLWHKAFVNAKSKMGITPLHLAAMNGYNSLVKLLIETHQATMDALSLAKKTPLHLSAQNGCLEVCETLLQMKADANAKDIRGQTPLHLAAENDHSDVVKLFLKHQPELVTMANTDENGFTCAHIASMKGSVAVIKELMRFNKVVVTSARNKTSDSTALHLAAAGGHQEVVKVLLEAGASATDENGEGMTAIHLAAKYGHVQVLEALKSAIPWNTTSVKTGLTVLHVAAHCGQINFVREMLTKVPATVRSESPSSPDAAIKELGSESGLTPLHLASLSGHESLVRLLLNSPGVQADSMTSVHGSVPLHLAAQSGHTAVVGLLLSKSTNQLHVKDKRGRTGLHLAAANGHYDMVALLIGQGADINNFDKNDWTSLHYAAKAGFLNVVKLLVESGASTKCETKDGKVPICYAAAASHYDVLSYLMKKALNTQLLMEDKKFVFDLMISGKSHENKPIEEFVLLSPAPVDTAAKLSKCFRDLSFKEKERARDLVIAGKFCETMATELLAIAASTNNAAILLKSLDPRNIQFLDVLIEHEQKDVVAHPAVQKYLTEVWMGNLHWATWKIVVLFLGFLICPPIWFAFSLPLHHRYNRIPIIKFMSYLVSHIFFILLLTFTVVYPYYKIWESTNLIPHWYEWLLLAWLLGILVSELTNPGDRTGLGWIRLINFSASAIAVVIHIIGIFFKGDDRNLCLYIRNQFLAISLLLCFAQLLEFLSFHHLFGPWAIIIRDLMKDLIRFLVILSIFVLGFTLHVAAVCQPVYQGYKKDGAVGNGYIEGKSEQTPFQTFEMLFFALFGLVEPDNLPPLHKNPGFSSVLVKIIFGVYMMITLVVLINLLIAMMSDTYQRIQAQSDTEWKFGRAKLIRNMNKTSGTPSPLNLITKLIMYIQVAYKHKGKICSHQAQEYIRQEKDSDAIADSRSIDHLSQASVHWLRNMVRVRRNTQVNPEDTFLNSTQAHVPIHIEDVVEWSQVVIRYLAMTGTRENYGTIEKPTNDDLEVAISSNKNGKVLSGDLYILSTNVIKT